MKKSYILLMFRPNREMIIMCIQSRLLLLSLLVSIFSGNIILYIVLFFISREQRLFFVLLNYYILIIILTLFLSGLSILFSVCIINGFNNPNKKFQKIKKYVYISRLLVLNIAGINILLSMTDFLSI